MTNELEMLLRAVTHHFGPDGAAKVAGTYIDDRLANGKPNPRIPAMMAFAEITNLQSDNLSIPVVISQLKKAKEIAARALREIG